MKQYGILVLLAGLMFPASAQDSADNDMAGSGSNLLKVNLSSFIAKNISLQYERVLSRRASLALGLRLMPQSSLPFRSSIESIVADGNPEAENLIRGASTGGFAITPEFRYYVGRGYGRGLYLAPFARYERFHIESTFAFTAPDDSYHEIGFTGQNNIYGIGLMLGYQFRITDHFYLDAWIAGPYYTHHSVQLDAGGFTISNDAVPYLQQELDKIEVLNFDVATKATTTTAQLRTSGSLGAVRALGLCLSLRL